MKENKIKNWQVFIILLVLSILFFNKFISDEDSSPELMKHSSDLIWYGNYIEEHGEEPNFNSKNCTTEYWSEGFWFTSRYSLYAILSILPQNIFDYFIIYSYIFICIFFISRGENK